MESFKVIHIERFKFENDFLKFRGAKIREMSSILGANLFSLGFQEYFDLLKKPFIFPNLKTKTHKLVANLDRDGSTNFIEIVFQNL